MCARRRNRVARRVQSGGPSGMSLASRGERRTGAREGRTMRISRGIAAIAGIAALCSVLGTRPARAEEEAPADPTRGQWDSFLDPLRDFEDEHVVGTQKTIEDKTKIHVGAGIQYGFTN